jgi:hypothetical protein
VIEREREREREGEREREREGEGGGIKWARKLKASHPLSRKRTQSSKYHFSFLLFSFRGIFM